MNLSDERNYQMRQEVLDVMGLSEADRKLAEEYLDLERMENPGLLAQMGHQDFSVLDKDARKKCVAFGEHLLKRKRMEDLARYVRFCAAVGGSTARYTLFPEWSHNEKMMEYLTREQFLAIHAELLVWQIHLLNIQILGLKRLVNMSGQDLSACRRAIDCCYHHSDNAKTLLSGIYLYHKKPEKPQGGFLKGLFSKAEKVDEDTAKVVTFLENCLISSTRSMFRDGKEATEEEYESLKTFLRKADSRAPFPKEILAIMDKGVPSNDYLTKLLTGVAFMAIEYSDRFLLFIRFAIYMNTRHGLDACHDMCSPEWFDEHIEAVEQTLTIRPEEYGCWCVVNKLERPLQRLARSNEAAVRRMLPDLETKEYQFLLEQVEKANPSLHDALNADYDNEFRRRMAADLTGHYQTGKTEARNYLLGNEELEHLYGFADQWREERWRYTNPDNYERMMQLRDGMDTAMFRKALVLEALNGRPWFFRSYRLTPATSERDKARITGTPDEPQITAMLDIFKEEKLPISYQLKLMEAIYDNYYYEQEKTAFMNECAKAMAFKKDEWAGELIENAQKGSVTVRSLCIRVLNMFWNEHKETLLSYAGDSSKAVRELLAETYAKHKEWEPEMLSLLASKKSQEREIALQVLGKWGIDPYREQLEKALESEKSKKIKDQIGALFGMETGISGEGEPGQAAAKTGDQLAAQLLKGGKKRKVEWVGEVLDMPVHKTDGSQAQPEHLQALLVAYADMSTPGVSADAARLAAELDQSELADLMEKLFGRWIDTGAEAKKKWVLYAVSIHGGEKIIPILHHQIQVWPEAARGAIAAEGVRALALNGSSTALLLVDQISRKFKNRQVKSAAGAALTYAAEQLGISRMELEDRIVPSLDFDERGERHFDYGTRSFLVKLTPALELEIFDGSGKKLKNMPAPGKQDDEEKAKASNDAFKMMKKQLKTVAANQKLRLEQALSAERLWPAGKWQELFVKNPIMHQFAIGLVWGVYEQKTQESDPASAQGIKLLDTFRYMEDGTFNTVDEEEYELPEHAQIGLVHPVELSEEILSAWKEQLSDYEVKQPFEQLERPVYRITEEEKQEKELSRFGGMLLNGLSLSGKLLGQGWYRGAVEDAGFYYTYYRNDGANGAELEFSGVSVGYEGEEVTVYGVYFYPSGEIAQGSYYYQKDYEKKRCLLSEVSPRYFSEIVLLMTRATASSSERLEYPECKNSR